MRKSFRLLWRILAAPFRFVFWILRLFSRWFCALFKDVRKLLTEEPEDESLADTFAKTVSNPMGLVEHLNALRKHLLRAILFLALTTAASFTFTPKLIDILAQPVGGIKSLIAIDVTEPIGVFMRVALLTGFAIALPYIAFELWLFAAWGLKKHERYFSFMAIPVTTIFFAGGMAFAYFLMLPTAIPFLTSFMSIQTELRPSTYIQFVTTIMFWIGVAFEFPLVIYILAAIGIVKSKSLRDQWRLAVIITAIFAAAITPTVDPINMGLVMGPMVLLYFLSIGLAYLAERARQRRLNRI